MKSACLIISINDKGSVCIKEVDQNDVESMIYLHVSKAKKEVFFPNIQKAYAEFLRPIHRDICKK